ncbi:TonB-dependent siderophore receptor [Reyranella sp.]|uniref:TonB-dependent siderophore receptor n=1 Tax=Reyranella sp. TaxID=1929291 RepID=UPI003D0FF6F8
MRSIPSGWKAPTAPSAQRPDGPGVRYVATRSVTGSKTDQAILETPQSISVVTRQQMDDQAVQSTRQALRYTPGIVSDPRPLNGLSDTNMLLRGFTPDQYLDGLKLIIGNFGYTQIDPYLLDRIEVLRGPSSVLYGQGTPGGIVALTSKRPTDTAVHEVMLQAGTYDLYSAAFDVGGRADGDGKLLYRITGLAKYAGSQVEFSNSRRFAIAPAFTWKPDAATSFTILGQFQRDSGPAFNGFVPARGSVLFNPNGQIPSYFYVGDPNLNDYTRMVASVGYSFEHRFDRVFAFRQNFRYQNLFAADNSLYASGLQANQKFLNRYAFNDVESLNTITVDNQLTAKFATGALGHSFLLGLDYQWNTNRQTSAINFATPAINLFAPNYYLPIANPVFNPTSSYTNARQRQDQIALYAQDIIKLGGFSLVLGGRQDWVSSSSDNYMTLTGTSKYDQAFTWRAGLVYLFDNGIAPYASYTTSFSPTAGLDFSGNPFSPTTGQQFEIGVKYQPTGFNGFFTLSAYNLTQQNVLTTDPQHPGFSVQTGEIRSRGIEFEARASLTDNIDLIGSYTYTDALTTKSNALAANIWGTPIRMQGQPVNGVPQNMASMWSTYRFTTGSATGLMVGGGVRYIGPQPGDTVNSFIVPGFTLYDAVVSYDLGAVMPKLQGASLQLNATNLFDTQYVASCANANFCSYGLGRNVYASLKYKW